ncbi:hypothetical protein ABTL46_21490, partial [Acinetobacter baumannii]
MLPCTALLRLALCEGFWGLALAGIAQAAIKAVASKTVLNMQSGHWPGVGWGQERVLNSRRSVP